MATLGALASQIAQWLDRDNEDEFPTSVRYWCINRAIEEVLRNSWCRWALFTATLTTVADQAEYALSSLDSNCYDVETVTYQDYDPQDVTNTYDVVVKLVKLSPSEAIQFFASANDNDDKPEAFTIEGENLVILPTPGGGIEMRVIGRRLLDELTDSSDTNSVTQFASEAVFWLALKRAATFFPGEEEKLQIIVPNARRCLTELEVREARAQQSFRPRDSVNI